MKIVSRSEWGAHDWIGPVFTVPYWTRTEFLVHYHGGEPPVSIGPGVPQDCERIHIHNGWAGIGYNFVVDQAGNIYEGRGWNLVGAHCPDHNRTGYGVYVAVGGEQVPTPAALTSVRWLYDEACNRTNKDLRKTWHGANYPTECPGQHLIDWVEQGMPNPPDPEEDDLPLSDDDIDRIVQRLTDDAKALYKVHDGDKLLTITDALTRIIALLENPSGR